MSGEIFTLVNQLATHILDRDQPHNAIATGSTSALSAKRPIVAAGRETPETAAARSADVTATAKYRILVIQTSGA